MHITTLLLQRMKYNRAII